MSPNERRPGGRVHSGSLGTPFPPINPPPTNVAFPDPRRAGRAEVLAVGGDFRAGTMLTAYSRGIFPWPDGSGSVPWCSMRRRAIFSLEGEPHWSRSLRRTLRITALVCTLDESFREVIEACGDERPDARWITPAYVEGFCRLHELGWAHSVEVWEKSADGGEGRTLVGGIYGIAIGAFFAGESMFHRRTDASKIAFATLVHALRGSGFALFDVQVMNPHLQSLGCVELSRAEYLDRLDAAIGRRPTQLGLARGAIEAEALP
jgi:leucyl/phenylalanyl-tRNA---protein transferase